MRRGVVPCGYFVVGDFCASLVRRTGDVSLLMPAFQSIGARGGPPILAPINSFDFVTGVTMALANARLISCADPLTYHASSAAKGKTLSRKLTTAVSNTNNNIAASGSIMASQSMAPGMSQVMSLGEVLLSVASLSVRKQSTFMPPALLMAPSMESINECSVVAPQSAAEEERMTLMLEASKKEKKAMVEAWERSLVAPFQRCAPPTTNDEVEYFDCLPLLEFCLLETFKRIDTAHCDVLTWAEFVSFLSDCTAPARNVAAAGGLQLTAEMLLAPVDSRAKELDTAVQIRLWKQRNMLVALCVEHYAQTFSIVDQGTLRPWRRHPVAESVGKILSFDVLPSYSSIAIITYSGLRVHDAENWVCKAQLHEQELLACVRWIPAYGLLVCGNQVGAIIDVDLSMMDRTFYSTNKPFAAVASGRRTAHTEIVTDILAELPSNFVVSSSMDGTIVMCHRETRATRVFTGNACVGMSLVEHLGLILGFGVDNLPFAFSFNVPDSTALILGNSATRGHAGRIIGIGSLDDEDFCVSVDKTGMVKVWDLVTNTCIQTTATTESSDAGKFLAFHSASIINGSDVQVVARRRRYILPYNVKLYGRVAPKAAQGAITSMAYDPRGQVVVIATGLELQFWSPTAGRLMRRCPVEFAPPPQGAPHGSVADRINSVCFSNDLRSLFVSSDKYSFNVHCPATGVCRSRHVVPVASGTLLSLRPVPVEGVPDREAHGALISVSNDNPKLVLHGAVQEAIAGAADANLRGRKTNAASLSTNTHVIDRLVLASSSDSLRVRMAVHHPGSDFLVCTECSDWGDSVARTLSAWMRLPNGSWGRIGSHTFDATIVAIVAPSRRGTTHFVVSLATGIVVVFNIAIPSAREAPAAPSVADPSLAGSNRPTFTSSVPTLHLTARFAHRRQGLGADLDALTPSALTFHPDWPRILVAGDDLGCITWYDVGDCLHRLSDPPPTPPPQPLIVTRAADSTDTDIVAMVPPADLSATLPVVFANNDDAAPDGRRSTISMPAAAPEQARICVGCGAVEDDVVAPSVPSTAAGHTPNTSDRMLLRTVWRIHRVERAHADGISDLAFIRLPFVPDALLCSSSHDGTVYTSVFDAKSHVAAFVDLSKRITGEKPPLAFTTMPRSPVATVPSSIRTTACDTSTHAGRFDRCSDVIVASSFLRRAAGAKPGTSSRTGTPQNTSLGDPSPLTVSMSNAIGGGSPQTDSIAAASPMDLTFMTEASRASGHHPPPQHAVAERDEFDDENENDKKAILPSPRSAQGLGLTHEHRVSMYKEWIYGEQERLKVGKLDRLEKLRLLHGIYASNAVDTVEHLLQTDDAVYEEAKRNRSPRLGGSDDDGGNVDEAKPHSHAAVRTLSDGRPLPSLAQLKRIARPAGRVRNNITDALSGTDKMLTMPPAMREAQVEAEHGAAVLKAVHEYKSFVRRTPAEVAAALESVEGMPRDRFISQLREESIRALRMEENRQAERETVLRQLRAAQKAHVGGRNFPAEVGKRLSRPPPTMTVVVHPRAAGGIATRRHVPKYIIDDLSRPEASTPPPSLPYQLIQQQREGKGVGSPRSGALSPDPTNFRSFSVPVKLHERSLRHSL